jgi:Tfp pilus assembly protein PilN
MKNILGKAVSAITSSNHYVFVHINDKELTLAQATKQKRNLHCRSIQQYPLQNTEIIGDRVFNMSRICSIIKDFASRHQIAHPHLIVHTPLALNNPYILLQITLCLGKKPFILDHVSYDTSPILIPSKDNDDVVITLLDHTSLTTNLLKFFLPPGYQTSKLWFASTGMALTLLVALAFAHHAYTYNKIYANQTNINTITTDINTLKTDVKVLHELEKKNDELDSKISILNTLAANHHNPYNLLATVAQKMPNKSRLSSLNIDKQTTLHRNNKKTSSQEANNQSQVQMTLLLHGITQKPAEISAFVKNLSDSFGQAQFSLEHIRKNKQSEESQKTSCPSIYTFSIRGSLPSSAMV